MIPIELLKCLWVINMKLYLEIKPTLMKDHCINGKIKNKKLNKFK